MIAELDRYRERLHNRFLVNMLGFEVSVRYHVDMNMYTCRMRAIHRKAGEPVVTTAEYAMTDETVRYSFTTLPQIEVMVMDRAFDKLVRELEMRDDRP